MFLMVTFIATLIHIYSMGYMHDDPRYPRFFTYLSLFCFSMLGLVASSNVFMIFIFWELVGVCSYLLIGFWYEEKVNCDAANKAFIVNRVGDVGMLVGLGLLWTSLGTFDFQEINQGLRRPSGELNEVTSRRRAANRRVVQLVDRRAGQVQIDPITGLPRQIPFWMLTIAGLGIFAGCVGKSAQFPLHVWLPDAMAGPTPVSALIHAATMVAAGVYLVGRFFPLFTGDVLLYIAYTGGITLFIAATIAMVQTDYKKVLAYSTVSQLGFMMLGLGVGGWAAGLFHLLTHAFFKALLFLGAGSVYHSVHTYEMPALGGLLKKMPITALDDARRHAGDLGRAVFQRVLLQGRDPGGLAGAGHGRPRAFHALPLPGGRRRADGFLHVPDVVLDLRRRAARLPTSARRPTLTRTTRSTPWSTPDHDHGHDDDNAIQVVAAISPWPRPRRSQPGRARSRERADHDLAADHPGGLQRLRRLDALLCHPHPLRSFGTPLLEHMLEYGEPYRAIDIELLHQHH